MDPVSIVEMRSYFGLLLLFGYLGKEGVEISQLWSSKSLHHVPYATLTCLEIGLKLFLDVSRLMIYKLGI